MKLKGFGLMMQSLCSIVCQEGEMLKNLIDPNETILWQGKPHHFLYTLGNPLIYPFALCWGIFDLFFMTKFNAASHGIFPL